MDVLCGMISHRRLLGGLEALHTAETRESETNHPETVGRNRGDQLTTQDHDIAVPAGDRVDTADRTGSSAQIFRRLEAMEQQMRA